jgi:multidrug efflux pump subunit AcrA (membrane-fusion protein)
MLNDVFMWIIGLIVAVLGGGLLFEKRKADKAVKAKKEAEAERDKAKLQVRIEQEVSKVKDELAEQKAQLQAEEKEVVHEISQIPEEKEVPLSDEVKKLAAEQATRAAARARARTERVQDNPTAKR